MRQQRRRETSSDGAVDGCTLIATRTRSGNVVVLWLDLTCPVEQCYLQSTYNYTSATLKQYVSKCQLHDENIDLIRLQSKYFIK